jgi:hypothetical protein
VAAGGYTVTITSITPPTGFSQTNTCNHDLVGQTPSCTMTVTFGPAAAGSYQGNITIHFSWHGTAGGTNSSINYYGVNGTATAPPQVTGFINPKYVVVGVTYAPPGPGSSVVYTSSTMVGTSTTVSKTFMQSATFTVITTRGIGAWTLNGSGVGVETSASESTTHAQSSSTSTGVTISQTSTVADTTTGTGNAFAPVNHDYDLIWLWLNPLLVFTVNPNSAGSIQWNGYGYDPHDPSGSGGMDIFPVQVGCLNGHFGACPSVATILARGWVTTYEPTIKWPTGDGPGLNSTDIAHILAADLFSSGTYSLPNPLPTTSADGRFQQISYPPNPVPYIQAGPGNGGGTTVSYDLVNESTTTLGQSTGSMFIQSFGYDTKLSGGFLGNFTVELQTTQTVEIDTSWQRTLTTTQTLSKALSVTGPGCPQTTPPCVPAYTGPGQFIVFQDNQFGTFMFYPGN